jgi:hypothetical protein
MITLQITRKEKNPEYKNKNPMYQEYNISEFTDYEILSVEITEEQFEAIRKAVLEKF